MFDCDELVENDDIDIVGDEIDEIDDVVEEVRELLDEVDEMVEIRLLMDDNEDSDEILFVEGEVMDAQDVVDVLDVLKCMRYNLKLVNLYY